MLPPDVADERLIEFVPGDLDRFGHDHAAERDDRDVRRTAADVEDHMASGRGDVDPGTDGGSDRLLDEVGPFRARLCSRVHHGAFLHLRNAAWHADDDARLEDNGAAGFFDKVLDHFLCDVVLRDDAVPQRTDCRDVAGSAPQHHLRLPAEFQYFACIFIDSDDRGLLDDDPASLYVDENRSGAQIDANVLAHPVRYPNLSCPCAANGTTRQSCVVVQRKILIFYYTSLKCDLQRFSPNFFAFSGTCPGALFF